VILAIVCSIAVERLDAIKCRARCRYEPLTDFIFGHHHRMTVVMLVIERSPYSSLNDLDIVIVEPFVDTQGFPTARAYGQHALKIDQKIP
jgi:hypothetical protein